MLYPCVNVIIIFNWLENIKDSGITTFTAISCTAPSQPQNGLISPELSTYDYNQHVTFQCNAGYTLVGETSITCIGQNIWSGEAPFCQGTCHCRSYFSYAIPNKIVNCDWCCNLQMLHFLLIKQSVVVWDLVMMKILTFTLVYLYR